MHEAINLASIWDLPCVFVCENNGYAEATSPSYSTHIENIADCAAAYGIPGVVVDGQSVLDVYAAAKHAIERARHSKGPTLIEAKTYRYYGHFEGDAMKYRISQEVEHHRQRDPLTLFAQEVAPLAGISAEDMQAIDTQVGQRMQEAIDFAQSSALPLPEECLTDVYITY